MQTVALVPRGVSVPPGELALVASAINVQVVRDLQPAWKVMAAVAAFPDLGAVPAAATKVIVCVDAQGKNGVHVHPASGEPFALVEYTRDATWHVAASHEVLELLVDSTLHFTTPGPNPDNLLSEVRFLVEICDPCQGIDNAYQVDASHKVMVSDFCLPAYYRIGSAVGGPFDHANAITQPFTVLPGGYVTWIDSDGNFFQKSAVNGLPITLGPVPQQDAVGSVGSARNWRGAVDRFPSLSRAVVATRSRTHRKPKRPLGRGLRGVSSADFAKHLEELLGCG